MTDPTTWQQLPLQISIGEGKDRQVELLFESIGRKLIQITLRNGAILAKHSAPVPITIQGVAGSGNLYIGEAREVVELVAGTLVTIEPGILHEIEAHPAVSILLTMFPGA